MTITTGATIINQARGEGIHPSKTSIVRSVDASTGHDPIAGLPLLVPLLDDGETIGHFTVEATEWEARQRAAWPKPS